MPNCTRCGAEINFDQFNNFNGMCPDCVRLFKLDKRTGGRTSLCWGFLILPFGIGFSIFGLMAFILFGFDLGRLLALMAGFIMLIGGIYLIYNGFHKLRA